MSGKAKSVDVELYRTGVRYGQKFDIRMFEKPTIATCTS